MSELRKCECGQTAYAEKTTLFGKDNYWMAYCSICHKAETADTKKQVISKWNTRMEDIKPKKKEVARGHMIRCFFSFTVAALCFTTAMHRVLNDNIIWSMALFAVSFVNLGFGINSMGDIIESKKDQA